MRLLTILFVLCWAASSPAQKEEETITTEIVTLSLDGGVPALYFRDSKNIAKLEVSAQGIGAPAAYAGPATLSLYDNPADLAPRDADKPVPLPSFQTPLPAGEDRVLLVFTANKSPDGPRRSVRAFGISTENLKDGDYRIFNFSSKSLYVIMNEEKAVVQPGKPADISAASWRADSLDMQVRFGLREGENLRQAYSSVWGHRPTRRTFLFILDRNDEFNPFEIRRYHDVPMAKADGASE